MMRRRGFTLIELLVVIAIIALLAAILFPVFGRAREQARKTACMSNMKQLYMAMNAYADDHDGWFPPSYMSEGVNCNLSNYTVSGGSAADTWMKSYIGSYDICRCPSRDRDWWDNPAKSFAANSYKSAAWWMTSYQIVASCKDRYAGRFYGWYIPATSWGSPAAGNTQGAPCPHIEFPGKTEKMSWYTVYIQPASEQPALTDAWDPSGKCNAGGYYERRANHPEGSNIVFVDGHAEWRSAAKMTGKILETTSPVCKIYW